MVVFLILVDIKFRLKKKTVLNTPIICYKHLTLFYDYSIRKFQFRSNVFALSLLEICTNKFYF